jgi:transglutaminase-like putative cysteine protease
MNRWLSFFEHKQPNPSVEQIWSGLFLNLIASVIPFIFIAPVAATITCAFLVMTSLSFHLLKWRLYGPLTYVFAVIIIASLRSTLPHGSFSGEFFATAFAVLALLKTFNLRYYGDGIILLILTLGVNSSLFLLDEDMSILVILWTFSAMLWTIGNLLRINLKNFSSPALLASMKSAAYATLYTLPLLLFLFFIFQKFSHTPFYNDRNDTMIGLSRSLEPGNISKLTASSNIALRVKLSEEEFPFVQLYWRGAVLTKSMGLRWGVTKDIKRVDTPPHLISSKNHCVVDQTIYLQNSSLLGVQFALDEPIYETYKGSVPYTISSEICTQQKNLSKITRADLYDYLKVQTDVSPDVKKLVQFFKRRSHSDEQYVGQILQFFKKNKFKYSLSPANADTLDDFLFKTKSGFCEHYAAAFATLARLGGLPSRIITGFQGGTYNRFGDYWVVSYKDAHAWTEIWMDKRGWVRFDPTAIVAPMRIQQGAEAMFGSRTEFLATLHLERAWMLIDAFFFWLRGLFDNRNTILSLDELTFNPFHFGALGFVFLCWLIIKRMNRDYSLAVYQQFKKLAVLLNERTIPRGRSEGYETYRLRLIQWLDEKSHLRPLAPSVDRVFKKYIVLRYSSKTMSTDESMELYRDIKTLQRAIQLKTNFLIESLRVKMPRV